MRNQVEAVQSQANDDEQVPGDGELSTSHLNTGLLASGSNLAYVEDPSAASEPADRPNTDWLRVLASQPEYSETFDDPLPEPAPEPSGMGLHSAPARIRPTIGARLAHVLQRGTLMAILAALGLGILGAGVYGLTFTSWFSSLLSPTPAGQQPAPARSGTGEGAQGGSASQAPQPAPIGSGQDSAGTAGAAGDARALVEKGVAQYKLGNYNQAIDFLESAIEADGSDAVTYYQIGLAYMAANGREHGLEDAEMAFRTAASLQPSWAAPYQLLAESLIRRGYFSGAIDPARQAVQLDSSQAVTWMTLGRAYRGAGRQSEAEQAFAEASRRSKGTPSKP
jgi:Tetratricopeptide repeat